jgi:hypothetical protein
VLFERLLPTDLQALLWQLRDRIKVVQVDSEEPWIPWELCKLQGREDGRIVEGPFLCEAFAMTRWLPGIESKPTLSLKNLALVLPRDSGLPLATSEGEYVLSLADGDRRVERIPATFLELRVALASGSYDGWHFTGHGGFRAPDPNRSAMLLEDQAELTPEDLSGVVSNLGLARPLVFLNACQIGRGALSLTDIGGWAAQFLRAGAAAFIGAYSGRSTTGRPTTSPGPSTAACWPACPSVKPPGKPARRSSRWGIPPGWPTRSSRIRWRPPKYVALARLHVVQFPKSGPRCGIPGYRQAFQLNRKENL